MEGLHIVASLQNIESDSYLVEYNNYYLGSATGAYLHDLIRKRDKKILPILKAKLGKPSTCISTINNCAPRYRLTGLIEEIENQKMPDLSTDVIGEPFSYIPYEQIEQKYIELKDRWKSR